VSCATRFQLKDQLLGAFGWSSTKAVNRTSKILRRLWACVHCKSQAARHRLEKPCYHRQIHSRCELSQADLQSGVQSYVPAQDEDTGVFGWLVNKAGVVRSVVHGIISAPVGIMSVSGEDPSFLALDGKKSTGVADQDNDARTGSQHGAQLREVVVLFDPVSKQLSLDIDWLVSTKSVCLSLDEDDQREEGMGTSVTATARHATSSDTPRRKRPRSLGAMQAVLSAHVVPQPPSQTGLHGVVKPGQAGDRLVKESGGDETTTDSSPAFQEVRFALLDAGGCSITSGRYSSLHGNGAEECTEGVPTGFSVRARDVNGLLKAAGGDVVTVKLRQAYALPVSSPDSSHGTELDSVVSAVNGPRQPQGSVEPRRSQDGANLNADDDFIVPQIADQVTVTDLGNGMYGVRYVPLSSSGDEATEMGANEQPRWGSRAGKTEAQTHMDCLLQVCINGEVVGGKACEVRMKRGRFASLRFIRTSTDGLDKTKDDRRLSCVSIEAHEERWGLAGHMLPADRATCWKIKVLKVAAGLRLGVLGHPFPRAPAWQDSSFFGWQIDNRQAYARGTPVLDGPDLSDVVQDGDVLIFGFNAPRNELWVINERSPRDDATATISEVPVPPVVGRRNERVSAVRSFSASLGTAASSSSLRSSNRSLVPRRETIVGSPSVHENKRSESNGYYPLVTFTGAGGQVEVLEVVKQTEASLSYLDWHVKDPLTALMTDKSTNYSADQPAGSFAVKDCVLGFTVTAVNGDGLRQSVGRDFLSVRLEPVIPDELQADDQVEPAPAPRMSLMDSNADERPQRRPSFRESGRRSGTEEVAGTEAAASEVSIRDNEDGTYSCDVIPRVRGQCRLIVELNGQPVQGTPMHLDVAPSPWRPLRFAPELPDARHVATAKRGMVARGLAGTPSVRPPRKMPRANGQAPVRALDAQTEAAEDDDMYTFDHPSSGAVSARTTNSHKSHAAAGAGSRPLTLSDCIWSSQHLPLDRPSRWSVKAHSVGAGCSFGFLLSGASHGARIGSGQELNQRQRDPLPVGSAPGGKEVEQVPDSESNAGAAGASAKPDTSPQASTRASSVGEERTSSTAHQLFAFSARANSDLLEKLPVTNLQEALLSRRPVAVVSTTQPDNPDVEEGTDKTADTHLRGQAPCQREHEAHGQMNGDSCVEVHTDTLMLIDELYPTNSFMQKHGTGKTQARGAAVVTALSGGAGKRWRGVRGGDVLVMTFVPSLRLVMAHRPEAAHIVFAMELPRLTLSASSTTPSTPVMSPMFVPHASPPPRGSDSRRKPSQGRKNAVSRGDSAGIEVFFCATPTPGATLEVQPMPVHSPLCPSQCCLVDEKETLKNLRLDTECFLRVQGATYDGHEAVEGGAEITVHLSPPHTPQQDAQSGDQHGEEYSSGGGQGGVQPRGSLYLTGSHLPPMPSDDLRGSCVDDLGNGSYDVRIIPNRIGSALLHVAVNGAPIHGSPFSTRVLPPPLRFTSLRQDAQGICLAQGGRRVTTTGNEDFRVVITEHGMLMDRPVVWAARIHRPGKAFLGITANPAPHEHAFDDPGVYVWHTSGPNAWVSGQKLQGLDGWAGFEPGDLAVFKYNAPTFRLGMQLHRQGHMVQTFSLAIKEADVGPDGFRVILNARCFTPCDIELIDDGSCRWNYIADAVKRAMRSRLAVKRLAAFSN